MKNTKQKPTITKHSPILVIGLGSIGMRHYHNLLALGYDNVYVHDVDTSKLTTFGDRKLMKIDVQSLKRFTVVFICNPSHLHVSTALLAAKAGCHLFIEKPLALSEQGLSELAQVMSRHGTSLMVGCNYRFHQGYTVLKKRLDDGFLGKALLARVVLCLDVTRSRKGIDYRKTYAADRKKGGGALIDSGVHVVDYLTTLFGKVVSAKTMSGKISALDLRSDDHANVLVRFATGVEGTITLDYLGKPKQHLIEIVCEKGLLRLDLVANTLVWFDQRTERMRTATFYSGMSKEDARNDMFLKEVRYFFDVLRGKKESVSGILHGVAVTKALKLMEQNSRN